LPLGDLDVASEAAADHAADKEKAAGGFTPLHVACGLWYVEARLLLHLGAGTAREGESSCETTTTPHRSICMGHLEIIKLLL